MHSLQDFMISRVRVKIFELFFQNVEELYYVREISRKTKEEINAVRRELDRMLGYGLLKSEERGNRLYYYLNTSYIFYAELQSMVAKSSGLGKKFVKYKRKLGTVDYVMFSGSFVEGRRPQREEVDVLVIGDVVLPEVDALIKEEEAKIGREINYTVFPLDEFEFRKTRRDPFVMDILYGHNILVIGNANDFVERKAQGL